LKNLPKEKSRVTKGNVRTLIKKGEKGPENKGGNAIYGGRANEGHNKPSFGNDLAPFSKNFPIQKEGEIH